MIMIRSFLFSVLLLIGVHSFKPMLVRVSVFYMIVGLLLSIGWAIWFAVVYAKSDLAFDSLLIATIVSQVFGFRKRNWKDDLLSHDF